MSRSTPTPTTNYPFTYTTYSTSLPSTSFTRPTIVPSLVPFGAALSCSRNAIAAPQISQPACAISNAREINDHAFWDLYECCKGRDVTATGTPNPCTAQCVAEDGQTWQELGDCLSKRVEVVVCKPADGEIANGSSSVSATQTRTTSSAMGSMATGQPAASGGGGKASASTGAGNVLGSVHVCGSKAAATMFGLLVLGSLVGMMA